VALRESETAVARRALGRLSAVTPGGRGREGAPAFRPAVVGDEADPVDGHELGSRHAVDRAE
jgi:hypothetical protein